MKQLTIVLGFLLFVISNSAAAMPITYRASGPAFYDLYDDSGIFQGREQVDFQGRVTIESEFSVTFESSTRYWYHYLILSYDLFTPYDSWISGGTAAGELLLELNEQSGGSWFGNAIISELIEGDFSWLDFRSANGTRLETLESAAKLPPIITLGYIDLLSNHTQSGFPNADITFTRVSAVAEPSAIILFAFGLAALSLVLKSHNRNLRTLGRPCSIPANSVTAQAKQLTPEVE